MNTGPNVWVSFWAVHDPDETFGSCAQPHQPALSAPCGAGKQSRTTGLNRCGVR
jgi:hypothetical protein